MPWKRLVQASGYAPKSGILLLLIMACAWMGCTKDLHHINTTASFQTLPAEGTRVLVWAEDPTVLGALDSWLQRRGLTVLRGSYPQTTEGERRQERTRQLLLAGKSLGVQQVIVAATFQHKNPDRLRVEIEGLGVQHEDNKWNSAAWEQVSSSTSDEERHSILIQLSCHALATAWKYRPAGYLMNVSLDYCHFPL